MSGSKIPTSLLEEVDREYLRATQLHGAFNSAHEGYAVILEELEELWDEIKKRKEGRDIEKMQKEAIQIAAMAVRFVTDICGE